MIKNYKERIFFKKIQFFSYIWNFEKKLMSLKWLSHSLKKIIIKVILKFYFKNNLILSGLISSKWDTFDKDVIKYAKPLFVSKKMDTKEEVMERKEDRKTSFKGGYKKKFTKYFYGSKLLDMDLNGANRIIYSDCADRLSFYNVPYNWNTLNPNQQKKIENLNKYHQSGSFWWDEGFQNPTSTFTAPEYFDRNYFVGKLSNLKYDLDLYHYYQWSPSMDMDRKLRFSPHDEVAAGVKFSALKFDRSLFPHYFTLHARKFKIADILPLSSPYKWEIFDQIREDDSTYDFYKKLFEEWEFAQFKIEQNIDYDPNFNPKQWLNTAYERGKMHFSALSGAFQRFNLLGLIGPTYSRDRRLQDYKGRIGVWEQYLDNWAYMENNILKAYLKILEKRKYERNWLKALANDGYSWPLWFKKKYFYNALYDFDLLPVEMRQIYDLFLTKRRPRWKLFDSQATRQLPDYLPLPFDIRNRGTEIMDKRLDWLSIPKDISLADLNAMKNSYFFFYRDWFDRFAKLDKKSATTIPYFGSTIFNKTKTISPRSLNFFIWDYELRLGLEYLIPTGSWALSEFGIILYIALVIFFFEVCRHEVTWRLLEYFPKFAEAQYRWTVKGQKMWQINWILAAIMPILLVLINDFGYGWNYTNCIAAYSWAPVDFDWFKNYDFDPYWDEPQYEYTIDELKYINVWEMKKYWNFTEHNDLPEYGIYRAPSKLLYTYGHQDLYASSTFAEFLSYYYYHVYRDNEWINCSNEIWSSFNMSLMDPDERFFYALGQPTVPLRMKDGCQELWYEFLPFEKDKMIAAYQRVRVDENDYNYFELEHMWGEQLMTPFVSLYGKALAKTLMKYPGTPIEYLAMPFWYRQTPQTFALQKRNYYNNVLEESTVFEEYVTEVDWFSMITEYVWDWLDVYETCYNVFSPQTWGIQYYFDYFYDAEAGLLIDEYDPRPTYDAALQRVLNVYRSWGAKHYEYTIERFDDYDEIFIFFDDPLMEWESEEEAQQAYAHGVTSVHMHNLILPDALYYYDFNNYAHVRRKLGNTFLGVDK